MRRGLYRLSVYFGAPSAHVVLYARTNPEHTPWKVKNEVLYFDIAPELQSKNQILKCIKPGEIIGMPEPEDIVTAVKKVLGKDLEQTENDQSSSSMVL